MTRALLAKVHIARKDLGLAEDDYRAILVRTTGNASAAGLSDAQLDAVVAEFRRLGWAPRTKSRPARGPATGALALEGPFVGKLRALWLTAWNLGLTEARTDVALAAFVERQTGLSSPSWVRDPKDAAKAIEGLKAWIGREAGLSIGSRGSDVGATKRALVRRQWAILIERGMSVRLTPDSDLADYAAAVVADVHGLPCRPIISTTLAEMTDVELDRLASALGAKIRKAKGTGR